MGSKRDSSFPGNTDQNPVICLRPVQVTVMGEDGYGCDGYVVPPEAVPRKETCDVFV